MLELQRITKIYNPGEVTENCLFQDFSLQIADGEFVSVVGSNGSGKTSLLNIICGSIPVESGRLLLDGKDITHLPEYRRYEQIGRVYQNPAMGSCPDLTILENLCLAENKNKRFGFGRAVDRKRAAQFAEMLRPLGLGLEEKLDVLVGALSGGQRQALSLLMATMTPIRFLILDEHTAALDPKTAEIIMELTDRIVREKGLTAIMVTHNLRYAVEYGSRMLMMHKGNVILDKAGEEKAAVTVADLLATFNDISIECGN
ncbi:MAG: ATP-binding cassette domain-containing protein [Clostridia bacterium]|nr:ATP-binding cassette domain-containing protein [Clostridia bacterium]